MPNVNAQIPKIILKPNDLTSNPPLKITVWLRMQSRKLFEQNQ